MLVLLEEEVVRGGGFYLWDWLLPRATFFLGRHVNGRLFLLRTRRDVAGFMVVLRDFWLRDCSFLDCCQFTLVLRGWVGELLHAVIGELGVEGGQFAQN